MCTLSCLLEEKPSVINPVESAVPTPGMSLNYCRVPALINIGKGHVKLVVDGDICKPLKGFLSLCPSGEGSNTDAIFSSQPWLLAGSGQLCNAPGSVCPLMVLPLAGDLFLSTGWAEPGINGQRCFAFDTQHIFLAFPGQFCYHKRAEFPYGDTWVDCCIAESVLATLIGDRSGARNTGAVFTFWKYLSVGCLKSSLCCQNSNKHLLCY